MSSIILDRLFSNPEVESGFNEGDSNIKKYINTKNILPAIGIMFLLRVLMMSSQVVLIGGIIGYVVFVYYNLRESKKKLDLLNGILFENQEYPFQIKSYLGNDDQIINFYYKNRWYIDYNLTAYRKSLQAVNNLLKIEYNLTENLMKYPEQLYQNAYLEYKEALNNFHSSIYKMISQTVNDDIFNDNLVILKKILYQHIENIQKNVIKCGYNLYNINIWSIINPSNEECKDDTKTKNYSPHYSFF